MVKRVVPDYADRVFYSCGPKLMVDDLVAMLEEMEPKLRPL
jgi:NAD(P)H-flavin reductase